VSIKNQHAPRDRNGVFTYRPHHRHHQFHTCSVYPHHSDTHCRTGEDQCRISSCSARTSGRRTVCFALTSNHLNDGLWSWKGICHGWFQLAIKLLMIAILQGIQLRILQSNAGLSPHSGLDMDSQDMLSQSSKSRR